MFVGRPGISPALAALIASGEVRRSDSILDVGCGTGTDVLTLARWGFHRVEGVDPEKKAIAVARSRATRARLGRRARFHHLAAEELSAKFPRPEFDVVLHTLVANNLQKGRDRHFRQIAAVMRPGGLLVLHERVTKRLENSAPGKFPPLPSASRQFRLTPGVSTHLAENPSGVRGPQYGRVVLWLGRPRRTKRSPKGP